MTTQLELHDLPTREDLRVYLERLLRVGEPEVRLSVRDGAVGVFGCTQAPGGLLDPVPVILVMRGFALADAGPLDGLDATVPARSLLDRIARLGPGGRTIALPDAEVATSWAGVLPPVRGWEPVGRIDAASMAQVARDGIERVAAALPDSPGDAIVRKARAAVWGVEMVPGVPAGAAFAAEALGFLHDETEVALARSRTWVRLSTARGHVLVR